MGVIANTRASYIDSFPKLAQATTSSTNRNKPPHTQQIFDLFEDPMQPQLATCDKSGTPTPSLPLDLFDTLATQNGVDSPDELCLEPMKGPIAQTGSNGNPFVHVSSVGSALAKTCSFDGSRSVVHNS